jgi:atypical dual specificity phosphatase
MMKPYNFSWFIEGRLAGSSEIYLEEQFRWLRNIGIKAVVSLTENPPNENWLKKYGFEYLHLPIRDYSAPSLEQIEEFTSFISRMESINQPVVVYCRAGQGRTGCMLALYLVSKGYTADEAILEVRKKRPASIDTLEQKEIIYYYEKILKDTR